jgi:hypothetical protein
MKNFQKNQLEQVMPVLPFSPKRPISLWDMIQFLLHQFVTYWEEFLVVKNHFDAIGIKSPGELVSADNLASLDSVVSHLQWQCKLMGMPNSTDRLWRFGLRLEREVNYNSSVMAELQTIHNTMTFELDSNYFVRIPNDKINFFENDNLFDEDFHKNASDEINAEIKDAGNCLAAGLKSSAGFHLMRIAEFGLRQLAQHRPAINQPDLAHALTAKRPIEEATWKMVYKAIDTEIKSRKDAGTMKMSEQEFYSHLMIQIRSFQFAWRDPIMHARFERPHEVDDMFDAVKSFMRELMLGGILTPH